MGKYHMNAKADALHDDITTMVVGEQIGVFKNDEYEVTVIRIPGGWIYTTVVFKLAKAGYRHAINSASSVFVSAGEPGELIPLPPL